MSDIDFVPATAPGDPDWAGYGGNADAPPSSTDPSCRVCGRPLVYGGHGRKPTLCDEHKRTTSSAPRKRGSNDVDTALSILGGTYDSMAMALMMLSPTAASQWAGNALKLQETNAVVLAADKDLCASINRMGAVNGKLIFFTTHLLAIVPVANTLRLDIDARVQERRAAAEATMDVDPSSNGHANERYFG